MSVAFHGKVEFSRAGADDQIISVGNADCRGGRGDDRPRGAEAELEGLSE